MSERAHIAFGLASIHYTYSCPLNLIPKSEVPTILHHGIDIIDKGSRFLPYTQILKISFHVIYCLSRVKGQGSRGEGQGARDDSFLSHFPAYGATLFVCLAVASENAQMVHDSRFKKNGCFTHELLTISRT